MRVIFSIILSIIFFANAFLFASDGKKTDSNKIIFLFFKIRNDSLFFEKSQIVSGKYKTDTSSNSLSEYLLAEVKTSDNRVIFTKTLEWPSKIHYDFIDSNNNLKGGVENLQEETFVIRMPYYKDLREVFFYKVKKEDQNLKTKSAKSSAKNELIAHFLLNIQEDSQK